MVVGNGSFYSVYEVRDELIKKIKNEGMSIRIPPCDSEGWNNRMGINKNTGLPDIGAVRNGNEAYFAIIMDFRECYYIPTRWLREYKMRVMIAKAEGNLEKIKLSYEKEGFSVRAVFAMLNCKPSDIKELEMLPLKGIERKIFSPSADVFPKLKTRIRNRILPDLDYTKKKNRALVIKEFLKEMFDIGIRPRQITPRDFNERGLGDFLKRYYHGSVENALIDLDFRI
ncbi:MAG: hypothetical protein QXS38_01875 [Candidatus Pacearchaeota archaeon]